MKIVDVSGFYSERGGGVRSYVRQKLRAGAEHGHEIVIVAPGAEAKVEACEGGKIIWVASPAMPFDDNYRMFWGARDVWKALDAERPDVVEGSSPWWGGWIAGRWPGDAAKALVFHQDFVAGYPYTALGSRLSMAEIDRLFSLYWRYARRLSLHFDVTVAGGVWFADRLSSFGMRRPVAVPFGIERGRFSPLKRDPALRAQLLARCGVGPHGKLLLAVGRMHPEKRYGAIIEGFARARRQEPDLGLVIVGDGLSRAAVERASQRAGGVHLAGAIDDRDLVARYYASADALVHGSGAETYGLAVAEAICSGLPVIVPDSGGAADLATLGPSLVYKTGDPAACAAAIVEMARNGAPTAIGANAPLRTVGSAEDHFSALFDLYQTLIDTRRAPRLAPVEEPAPLVLANR